jgi:uncharacterized protein (DUF1684 family)
VVKQLLIGTGILFFLWNCNTPYHFEKKVGDYRNQYLQSFLTNPRSPLDSADRNNIRFFKADKQWKKKAEFEMNTKETLIQIPTYSGINKPYRIYGYFIFSHEDIKIKMEVYQSAQKPENPLYKNHLFLPFKDETNDEESYGGGRYLDLLVQDIKNNSITLDFNKCYNPWCAYSEGYNCPVPPVANHLPFKVNAGEKMYLGKIKSK